MIFSIGDLITFVVVLLMLVIFRALDRNNRSLEKLKRFSDKITENLSALVEQKTGQVKDLSLELQANLKTGKEILTRARGVEELLQGRTDGHRGNPEPLRGVRQGARRAHRHVGAGGQEPPAHQGRVGFRGRGGPQDRGIHGAPGGVERQIPELEQGFAAQAREELEAARGPRSWRRSERRSAALRRPARGVGEEGEGFLRLHRAPGSARGADGERTARRRWARPWTRSSVDLKGKLAGAAQRGETPGRRGVRPAERADPGRRGGRREIHPDNRDAPLRLPGGRGLSREGAGRVQPRRGRAARIALPDHGKDGGRRPHGDEGDERRADRGMDGGNRRGIRGKGAAPGGDGGPGTGPGGA